MKNDNQTLKRTMTSRHIMMMALGGAIGAGLFKGAAQRSMWQGHLSLSHTCSAGLFCCLLCRGWRKWLFETVTPEPSVILSSRYWEITLLTFGLDLLENVGA